MVNCAMYGQVDIGASSLRPSESMKFTIKELSLQTKIDVDEINTGTSFYTL